jgi:hypothetical protein
VLNWDEPNSAKLADRAPAEVAWFSGRVPVEVGAWLVGSKLVPTEVHAADGARRVDGRTATAGFHNILNTLAACATAGRRACSRHRCEKQC